MHITSLVNAVLDQELCLFAFVDSDFGVALVPSIVMLCTFNSNKIIVIILFEKTETQHLNLVRAH